MKKQAINRQYNFPDADLYQICMEAIRYAKRDLEYFLAYGHAIDKLSAFSNLCEQFNQLPNDDELVGDQMVTTERKNEASERLKGAIRSLMTRVAIKYNNRSGRYRKFGTAKMGDMTDAQLLFCGRRVARVARQQLALLADVGINENIIAKVAEAARDFENALNIQQDKVADRDIGNKLYAELVTLCNIGKDIWAEKDYVRYENYVLYESNNDQKIARKLRESTQNATTAD